MGYLILAALLILAEQLLKRELRKKDLRKVLFGGIIRINPVVNKGIIMGGFKKSPRIPAIIQTVALVLLLIFAIPVIFFKNSRAVTKFGAALMLSGAGGNVLDRLIYGGVLDYIQFPKLKKFGKIVFDLADFFLLIGSVLLIVGSFLKRK